MVWSFFFSPKIGLMVGYSLIYLTPQLLWPFLFILNFLYFLCLIDSLGCNFQRLSHFTSKRVCLIRVNLFGWENAFYAHHRNGWHKVRRKETFFYSWTFNRNSHTQKKLLQFNKTGEEVTGNPEHARSKKHVFHTWLDLLV